MLSSTNSLYICCMYAHVNEHILPTHQVLSNKATWTFKEIDGEGSIEKTEKRLQRNDSDLSYITFIVASLGNLGKPFTEFESIERKICSKNTKAGKHIKYVNINLYASHQCNVKDGPTIYLNMPTFRTIFSSRSIRSA